MKEFPAVIITLLILCMPGCGSGKADPGAERSPVRWLETGSLKVGVLTEVGGRIVFLGRPEGSNLLKSDTALWNEPPAERIDPSPRSEFRAYNGHITWLGPQSEWWAHQNLNPARRDRKAVWPPDPYLVYAPYSVLEHTETSLQLEGPSSPVSGVKLTKRYALEGNTLVIGVTMTNTSGHPVAWDLWSNARFEGSTPFLVPGCGEGILRNSTEESGSTGRLDPVIIAGAVTIPDIPAAPDYQRRYAKLFLHPEKGRIVAVSGQCMLVMEFPRVHRDSIHPEQAFVEVYKMVTRDGKGDLLELEHHSPHVTLQPGESHSLEERWSVHPYEGSPETEAMLQYFNQLEMSKK
jgi:hypothetical protein